MAGKVPTKGAAAPFIIPQFTKEDYTSFFTAGMYCSAIAVQVRSIDIFQEHYVARMCIATSLNLTD